jgi:hypothetical protein
MFGPGSNRMNNNNSNHNGASAMNEDWMVNNPFRRRHGGNVTGVEGLSRMEMEAGIGGNSNSNSMREHRQRSYRQYM